MKYIIPICLLVFSSCASDIAWQDIPPRPERDIPTPEERWQAEGNPDIIAKIADQTAGPQWDRAGAVPMYEKALVLDPNHVRAHLGLAVIFTRCGNPTKARRHWESVARHAERGTPERAHAEGILKYLKQKDRENRTKP